MADRELRKCARDRSRLDVREAGWLLEAVRTDAHRHRGCASFLEYLERVLGYGPQAAHDRIQVATALERLPRFRQAMLDGELVFSSARELARVITADTEDVWLDAAKGKTVREVQEKVSGRKKGDGPNDAPDPSQRKRVLRLELTAETYALYREAQRTAATNAGHYLEDDEVVNAMARALLDGSGEPTDRPRYQIAITRCDRCKRGWQDGGGTTAELAPDAVAVAECDAERVGCVDGPTPERSRQDFTPAVRRQIRRRDRNRCVVPGCRSTRNLDVHHIVHQEHGGDGSAANGCLLCGGHHRAHHRGLLSITGSAPDLTIRFAHETGTTTAGPPPASGPEDGAVDLVIAALTGLGFKRHEAWVAVNRCRPKAGANPTFDQLLRAALQSAPKPKPGASSG